MIVIKLINLHLVTVTFNYMGKTNGGVQSESAACGKIIADTLLLSSICPCIQNHMLSRVMECECELNGVNVCVYRYV